MDKPIRIKEINLACLKTFIQIYLSLLFNQFNNKTHSCSISSKQIQDIWGLIKIWELILSRVRIIKDLWLSNKIWWWVKEIWEWIIWMPNKICNGNNNRIKWWEMLSRITSLLVNNHLCQWTVLSVICQKGSNRTLILKNLRFGE